MVSLLFQNCLKFKGFVYFNKYQNKKRRQYMHMTIGKVYNGNRRC